MAFLWDTQTEVDCFEGLQLNERTSRPAIDRRLSSVQSRRAPRSDLNLPTIEPIVWSNPRLQMSHVIQNHVERHLEHAEAFASAFTIKGNYTKIEIPSEISQIRQDDDDKGKGFSLQRARRWQLFLL